MFAATPGTTYPSRPAPTSPNFGPVVKSGPAPQAQVVEVRRFEPAAEAPVLVAEQPAGPAAGFWQAKWLGIPVPVLVVVGAYVLLSRRG